MPHPDYVPLPPTGTISAASDEGGSREEVLAALFRVECAGLVRLAYVVLGDRCAAEDVVVEAFCSLHAHWSAARRRSDPVACLRAAVLFSSRSRIREMTRERARRTLPEAGVHDTSSDGATARNEATARDEAHALADGVRALPDRQREVTVCRYYLELSEAETAQLLGISVGAVRRHAHRRGTAHDRGSRPMCGSEDRLREALRAMGHEVEVSEEDIAHAQHRLAHRRAQQVSQRRRTSASALAAAAVLAVALGSGALLLPNLSTPAVGPAAPGRDENGWVAFATDTPDGGSGVYLVREGQPSHRIFEADGDSPASMACPAFSPDGARLVASQANGTEDRGWHDPTLVITDLTADGEPVDTITRPLNGLTDHACAIWSADNRWLAFKAGPTYAPDDQVWVIDTQTNDIRRLTGLEATDIEWAPDAPELFIASNGILVYSIASRTTRPVDNTSGLVAFTLSPDGRSLAAQDDTNMDLEGSSDLVLMAADGSDRRTLVADYTLFIAGIGPVWSPDGTRIAFQRSCNTLLNAAGTDQICREQDEVVVVDVTAIEEGHDPVGTMTVIAPPRTTRDNVTEVWTPISVHWSPDSTTLLYFAFSDRSDAIVVVPVDAAEQAVVLDDDLDIDHSRSAWLWAADRG